MEANLHGNISKILYSMKFIMVLKEHIETEKTKQVINKLTREKEKNKVSRKSRQSIKIRL